jgi:hypothetical protein
MREGRVADCKDVRAPTAGLLFFLFHFVTGIEVEQLEG